MKVLVVTTNVDLEIVAFRFAHRLWYKHLISLYREGSTSWSAFDEGQIFSYYCELDLLLDCKEVNKMVEALHRYGVELYELDTDTDYSELWQWVNDPDEFINKYVHDQEFYDLFLEAFGVDYEAVETPSIDYSVVNDMNEKLVPSEYLSIGRFFSTLDGRFSAKELRMIAEVMDRLPEVIGPDGQYDTRNDRDRR